VDTAIKTKRYAHGLAPLLALAMVCSAGSMLNAQTASPSPMPSTPPTAMPPTSTSPPSTDDITRREVAEMDQFLDNHPEISEQLRKDPSLIDNRKWVAAHPALQEYMQDHPRMSEAFRTNPNLFMRDEERYERHEGDHDISRRDVVEMDRFLDSHPEISEQLRKDPSLIDNKQWVANHPGLQEYLKSHPQVAEAFRSNPNAFMRDEERYDRHDDRASVGDRDRDGRVSVGDRDDHNRGELTSFGQFLGGHSKVATEISNDPSLATNKEYLTNHPELNEYLKAHPAMSQQLAANPQAVMSSNLVQQGSGFTAKPVGPSKPKSTASPNQ
jgi:hypothetical protein